MQIASALAKMYSKICRLFGYAIVLCFLTTTHNANAQDVELNSFKTQSEYDSSWIDWETLRLKKISRSELGMTGDVNLKRNLGNEQRVTIQIFKYDRDANRRGPIVFQVEKPFCELVEENKNTYDSMAGSSNLLDNFQCPYPKDVYTFNDYVLQTDFLPPDTPIGDYIVVMTLRDAEKGVSGVEVDLTVT